MRAHDVAHECETEGLHRLMARLSGQQQRVLRSWIWHVEFGEMTAEEWWKSPTVKRVAKSTWHKPAGQGGNYWHDPAFRAALDAYKGRVGEWELLREERALREAGQVLRLNSVRAARRVVQLMDQAESETVRLNAAKDILNRIEETAERGIRRVTVEDVRELSDEELLALVGDGDGTGAGGIGGGDG